MAHRRCVSKKVVNGVTERNSGHQAETGYLGVLRKQRRPVRSAFARLKAAAGHCHNVKEDYRSTSCPCHLPTAQLVGPSSFSCLGAATWRNAKSSKLRPIKSE